MKRLLVRADIVIFDARGLLGKDGVGMLTSEPTDGVIWTPIGEATKQLNEIVVTDHSTANGLTQFPRGTGPLAKD